MTSRGMDCSGLVSRVLKAHGIRAPHSSAALFKMGAPVSVKELRAGDLLFFVTRGRRVSHVGLYIGEGKFVHASSRSGGVITSSLSEAYYAKRYAGARRMF
jgi:cell wall-associated NlpC family hydrolase